LPLAKMAARLGVRDIYFDACGFAGEKQVTPVQAAQAINSRQARLIPYFPQIILPSDQAVWLSRIEEWSKAGLDAAVVNNLGQIGLLRSCDWRGAIYAGGGLNVFNSAACRFLAGEGVKRVMLSPELNLTQIRQLDADGLETEVFSQGALQLMVSEYCMQGAICGLRHRDKKDDTPCMHPCLRRHDLYISDEKGYRFPLRSDHDCRMHVFNSREHCLLEDIPALSESGVERMLLDLRLYEPKRAEALLSLYLEAVSDGFGYGEARRKLPSLMQEYTKGHLYRGV
jgi:putative protease